MQDEQQFEQLMLQYKQLKNGAEDISEMLQKEDFDGAITLLKNREKIFLNCKCMRNYLELTPTQQKELDNILDEIRTLELKNMKYLEQNMAQIQTELRKAQQSEKFQQAYDSGNLSNSGSIINIQE